MPENNFNNENEILDLPKPNNQGATPSSNSNFNGGESQQISNSSAPQSPKPIIEIPQSYYDKIAAEEQEKAAAEALMFQKNLEKQEASSELGKMLTLVIFNAVMIFVLLILTVKTSEIFIFGIPAYMVILAIIHAIKHKLKSDVPASIMVGGILVAVITFIISMLNQEQMDLWIYYAAASAVSGFGGLILTNIITKLIGDIKNVKALQSIGYLIIIAAFIAVPFYLYNKFPEQFYKIVFQKQTEVKAETADEYLLKTLKNRYNGEFTCDNTTIKHHLNEKRQKWTERTCKDAYQNEFTVTMIAYNEGENKHIVLDEYLNELFINKVRTKVSKKILDATSATEINLYFYPEKNCSFYGDCADCPELYERYEEENNSENQYNESKSINFAKDLNESPLSFINNNKFKVIIELKGSYAEGTADYNLVINTILNELNNYGIKNTYGYLISIHDFKENVMEKEVYKVKGDTNQDQKFTNPIVVDLSAN